MDTLAVNDHTASNTEIQRTVCRWDIFELTVSGPSCGNPFTGQWIRGTFQGAAEKKTCAGFYDGDGVYKVRFMPSFEGEYTYSLETSFGVTESGTFTVEPAAPGNHGPVHISNTYHFSYEDGTPHYSFGTTCYVWELQKAELQEETLKTLAASPFNKIRFCVFPKHYIYNFNEPLSYPFEGHPMDSSVLTRENFNEYDGHAKGNEWDFTRPNPKHFAHIEDCIRKLGKLGIEADLILFHPYDRWGFSCMTRDQDEFYLKYLLARFSAFHNVWWSLANEYDFMKDKKPSDWEHIADVIVRNDPYQHLRSIHNGTSVYDHRRPWVTHVSMQRTDIYKTTDLGDSYRAQYKKPVVFDEICYEGDIPFGWGNISGKELIRRYWEAVTRGCYPGHGETFVGHDDILWWSHGGKLHGESAPRIAFLKKILEEGPEEGLKPLSLDWDAPAAVPDKAWNDGSYYLFYYGFNRPSEREFNFDEKIRYRAEVIDTWEMTVTDAGVFSGKFTIPLPKKEYMAIRLTRLS